MNQRTRPLKTVGISALAVVLFLGGVVLRDRTDDEARVVRQPGTFDGLLASQSVVASQADGPNQIPLGDYYSALKSLLQHNYVETIPDDRKLASGAVRGMIGYLGDPRSSFMDANEYKAFLNAREGRYEGIGAEFELISDEPIKKKTADPDAEEIQDPREAIVGSRVPRLVVTMVVPGGPAARSGVKPGDVVAEVDKHWVVDNVEIARFEQARKLFAAKKIPYEQIAKLQQSLRKKAERALMPAKAKDRLFLGVGPVEVVWKRGGTSRTTKIVRARSTMPTYGIKNGALIVRFDTKAPSLVREAIKGKDAVTFDLRNNVDGDFDSMRKVLAVVAPNGIYGSLTTHRHDRPAELSITNGNARPPRLTLLVDATTRGPASIFARALALRHAAKLVGSPGGDNTVREAVGLPDGTGYTLVTSEYSAEVPSTKVALAETQS